MELVLDKRKHDRRQLFLTRVLARELHRELQAAGLTSHTLTDTVERLLFGITAIVDGSRVMDDDGERVVPVLMFEDAYPPQAVVTNGGTSFMHEYASGIAEEVIEAAEATGE